MLINGAAIHSIHYTHFVDSRYGLDTSTVPEYEYRWVKEKFVLFLDIGSYLRVFGR